MGERTNRSPVRHQRCNLGRRYDNKDVCYADGASCSIIRLAYTVSIINYTRNKNLHTSGTATGQLRFIGAYFGFTYAYFAE